MGEVFRARDERLGRDVALKFVRSTSQASPDHLRRFEQEARAAASLNHPNILVIYDVGAEGGVPYIISEMLEGRTLQQILLEGPLTVRLATNYTLQLAQGLIAAHDGNIVHRDLKPGNLFIKSDGRLKILDFGVAKLQAESELSPDELPTVTKPGSLIGTVAYMSPEQLRGKTVDHRSDLFSVGAILYEMLTGRRAFRGESEADTITAVLREEPPEANFEEAQVPPAFRDVVRHCLEKEVDHRFQSARDLAFAVETLSGPVQGWSDRRWNRKASSTKVALSAVAGLLLAGALLLLGSKLRGEGSHPAYERLTFEEGTVYSARFVPDGQGVIYGAAWNGKPVQLYTTVGNSSLAQPLNLSDANLLAISRSNELAILMHGVHTAHLETENGTLASAPLAGGSPREMLVDVRWADWDPKGQLAVVHHTEGHSRLEYPIGHVLYESSGWISHIRFSPDGKLIAFMDHSISWDSRGSVCVIDLAGKVRELSGNWESEAGVGWSPDGKEVWFSATTKGNNRNLMAVSLKGRVRTLLDLPGGFTLQDVASDGRALVSLNSERLAMAATSPDGTSEQDLSWHDWNVAKDISQDGQWVLFEDASEAAGSNNSVALRKLDGALPIRLGDGSAGGLSPDGKWAIAVSKGNPEHVTLLPIGPGQARPIETAGLEHIGNGSGRFLADGKRIVVDGNEPGHSVRCFLVDVNGGKPRAITPEGIGGGMVSPDGRYVIGFGANPEVALYPLDGGPVRLIPQLEPHFTPVQWSQDSSALYGYLHGELPSRIYKVDVATGKKTVVRELRPSVPAGVVNIAPVVVSRDGKRYAYSYYQTLSVLYLVSGLR